MDIENVGEAMGETDAVPVDLEQTWGKGRNVDGDLDYSDGDEESSLVYTPPEKDGENGYVDADGNPVDQYGKDIPQSDGKGGWVDGDGKPVTKEGAPLPPADGSIPGVVTPGFTVSTGSLRDAETTILGLTNTEIDAFETFRDSVMQRASWIFYSESYEQTVVQKQGGGPPLYGNTSGTFDWRDVEYAPNVIDPHPEQTAQLQYYQYQMLQSVGGVLELVGQYVAKLNNSAQMYASADIKSAPPTD